MQTQDCTYANDGGTPPTIISSHCVTVGTTTVATSGTTTVAIPASVVAYDPLIETALTVVLFIVAAVVTARLILSFK